MLQEKNLICLSKNMQAYVYSFIERKEFMILYNTKNSKVFRSLLDLKYTLMNYYCSNPSTLKRHNYIGENNDSSLPNNIVVFENLNKKLLVVYPKLYNLIQLDLESNSLLLNITAHRGRIYCLQHFKFMRKDLLISSSEDSTIRLWSALELYELARSGSSIGNALFSTIFLEVDKKGYIISSSRSNHALDLLRIGDDFSLNYVKSIGEPNNYTRFITPWLDPILGTFLILCNTADVKMYEFSSEVCQPYRKYKEGTKATFHCSAAIIPTLYQMVESDEEGCVRFWEIKTEKLIRKVELGKMLLRDVLIWNDETILVGGENEFFVLNKNQVIKTEVKPHPHICIVGSLLKLKHKHHGESLLVSSSGGGIYLWTNNV